MPNAMETASPSSVGLTTPSVPTRSFTLIRRSSWPERWVPPQNRPLFTGGAHSGSSSAGPPPEDLSHPGCWLRYASFVLSLLVVASAAMFATPALLLTMSRCPFGCLSLEKDLIRSINTSVHPCNDFYEHVCNGWDRRGGGHPGNPLRRYISAFERAAVKSLLLEPTPQRLTSVKQRATAFIVRCLNSVEMKSSWTLQTFLGELGLPWPYKSRATRPQLLDILVRASLQYGLPIFWAFAVGRHPTRQSENTIYMTLDTRFSQWMLDIETLTIRSKSKDYLRRCAEIVGGLGQSYSRMIEEVLLTHEILVGQVKLYWGMNEVPRFEDLRDADMRRALNGYLPDESQLWPENHIVNLQPEFYENLNSTHLTGSASMERFKLFLGAYAVWALSPVLNRYLLTSLLEDTGTATDEWTHRYHRCNDALETLMPLIKWEVLKYNAKHLISMWRVLQHSLLSLRMFLVGHDARLESYIDALSAKLSVNAFNMTGSWSLLEHAYGYLPKDSSGAFFDLYLRTATATVDFFKRSMRRPRHAIFHVPGIVNIWLYQLLVGREVVVPPPLAASPLLTQWHPAAVLAAFAGTFVSTQLIHLVRFNFYDDMFEEYPDSEVPPGAWSVYEKVLQFIEVLNASDVLPNASEQEIQDVYTASVAAHLGSHTAVTLQSSDPQAVPTSGQFTAGVQEDLKLFFLVNCFAHCGTIGRLRQSNVAICNLALPAAPFFRRAFNCGRQHRLTTNFTWRDFTTEGRQ